MIVVVMSKLVVRFFLFLIIIVLIKFNSVEKFKMINDVIREIKNILDDIF